MPESNSDRAQQYIAIWTKTVDTQMHFNEMSVKSRQLGLTFVAAALGLAVVLLSRHEDYSFPISIGWLRFRIDIALLLIAGAALALEAVRQLDLNVYHKMLRGAVAFGEDFEENYMKQIFTLDKGMTQAISHFSRYSDARVEAKTGTTTYVYSGTSKASAGDKIGSFYKNARAFLLTATLLLFLITNATYWKDLSARAPEHATGTAHQTSLRESTFKTEPTDLSHRPPANNVTTQRPAIHGPTPKSAPMANEITSDVFHHTRVNPAK